MEADKQRLLFEIKVSVPFENRIGKIGNKKEIINFSDTSLRKFLAARFGSLVLKLKRVL